MRNFDEILAKIARDNGTTPEDVLHEMQVAMMRDEGNVMAVFEETQGNRIRMTDGAGRTHFAPL